ncbi:MAG: TetR/AcrR family transcriptional regulator, partial [Novosphingobium sp.]
MEKNKSLIARRRTAAKDDSSANYVNRKQEIIQAAVQVFHRLGYAKASLTAIATEMGIDRASIYYYFSSKEDVFDEIISAVLKDNDLLAQRIASSDISPTRKLRDLVSALMISYAENYPLLYLYIREDLSNISGKRSEWSARMRDLNRSIERSVVGIIEQGFADCSFRKVGSARTVA